MKQKERNEIHLFVEHQTVEPSASLQRLLHGGKMSWRSSSRCLAANAAVMDDSAASNAAVAAPVES